VRADPRYRPTGIQIEMRCNTLERSRHPVGRYRDLSDDSSEGM